MDRVQANLNLQDIMSLCSIADCNYKMFLDSDEFLIAVQMCYLNIFIIYSFTQMLNKLQLNIKRILRQKMVIISKIMSQNSKPNAKQPYIVKHK